ncbi:MAG: ABC transporter substrate-binding protein [Desulfobacteraceae bacterium]|jgi:branched-chain amino acid transport system substrate-binding protein|nr:ABC transporter substrate-binding protein [Desulfobacteraceae bacterium]
MKTRKLLAVFGLCVFALSLFAGGAMAADKVLKIGVLFPLTGPVATAGQRCVAAVETAAEVINNAHPEFNVPLAAQEGILGGTKIQLVVADHQGKPDVGKSEAERLFNQEGVWAMIGCYNSAVTKPASAVAERMKHIFLSGCSSSAALTERDYKYFFRCAPTDKTESHEFVEYIQWLNQNQNAGIKTVGLIYENTEFGKHAADEGKAAAKEAGFDVLADVAFNPGATNLNSEVQTLKAKNPDAVFGACLGGDYTLWVRTMKQMNWLPKVVLNYCTGYQDPKIAQQLGPDGDFFMGGTGYSPEIGAKYMPDVAAVETIYTAKVGVPFDSDSIQEAVALLVLAQAIEKAGSLDVEKVAEVLRTETFDSPLSLGGKVAFGPGGQNMKATSIVTQLHGGKYMPVFPQSYAEQAATVPMTPWDKR